MRIALAALVVALTLTSAPSFVQAQDSVGIPVFPQGKWHFERQQEQSGKSAELPNAEYKKRIEREHTRCVDPMVYINTIFEPKDDISKTCKSTKPVKVGLNKYVSENRCDYMGPVRTELTVSSDQDYTEVNVHVLSKRKDVIIAHRLGDCDPQ